MQPRRSGQSDRGLSDCDRDHGDIYQCHDRLRWGLPRFGGIGGVTTIRRSRAFLRTGRWISPRWPISSSRPGSWTSSSIQATEVVASISIRVTRVTISLDRSPSSTAPGASMPVERLVRSIWRKSSTRSGTCSGARPLSSRNRLWISSTGRVRSPQPVPMPVGTVRAGFLVQIGLRVSWLVGWGHAAPMDTCRKSRCTTRARMRTASVTSSRTCSPARRTCVRSRARSSLRTSTAPPRRHPFSVADKISVSAGATLGRRLLGGIPCLRIRAVDRHGRSGRIHRTRWQRRRRVRWRSQEIRSPARPFRTAPAATERGARNEERKPISAGVWVYVGTFVSTGRALLTTLLSASYHSPGWENDFLYVDGAPVGFRHGVDGGLEFTGRLDLTLGAVTGTVAFTLPSPWRNQGIAFAFPIYQGGTDWVNGILSRSMASRVTAPSTGRCWLIRSV